MRVCLVSLLRLIPTSAVAQTADVPRTAWGVPDLSGYWEYRTTTPLASEREPQLSPDGAWIAFASNETGQYEVYVARFPELGDRQPVSRGLGRQPVWAPNGSELLYVGSGSTLFAVAVETEPVLTTGTPEPVFQWPFATTNLAGRLYDVAPSGDRFLVMDTPGNLSAPQIIVVENWFEELEARVPVP